MYKHIKHIGIILLMGVFVFATSGIYITLHQCHTTGHHSIHIMDPDPRCDHDDDCCHETNSNHTHQHPSSSCQTNPFHCSNKSQHIAIENDFVPTTYQLNLSPTSLDLLDESPLFSQRDVFNPLHPIHQHNFSIPFSRLLINKEYTCLLI